MTQVIETRALSSQEIMDLDRDLLEDLQENPRPILHLYSWPTATLSYGLLVDPNSFIDREAAKKQNLSLAKRPTGGGLIFHLTDLAFSFLLPSQNSHFSVKTNENYVFVNSLVAKALKKFMPENLHLLEDPIESPIRFCMAKATQFDLLLDGGKLVGAAQRRTRHGLLHQGSISLSPPPFDLLEELLLDKNLLQEMRKTSRFLSKEPLSKEALQTLRHEIEESLKENFIL